MKELKELIKRVETEINKTPTSELRNLLCDVNIELQNQALNMPVVTDRTCVTCLYCQINPTSEFIYDRHKCTLVKPFVSITDATKFVCDDWTEIPF